MLLVLQLNQQAPVPAPETTHHGRHEEMQHGSSPPSTHGFATGLAAKYLLGDLKLQLWCHLPRHSLQALSMALRSSPISHEYVTGVKLSLNLQGTTI